ncbi:hypothetical protein ER57_11480 [Smithella sp. SCADC]|nr:hypothetical protein ER57_11480 [Smithella sp. SCADC]
MSDYRVNEKKSLNRAERSANQLKKFFDGYRVPEITTPKIQGYIEERLADKKSNATINRELAALKRILNLGFVHCAKHCRHICKAWSLLPINPGGAFLKLQV